MSTFFSTVFDCSVQFPPQVRKLVVEELYDVKAVKDQHGIGQMGSHGVDVRGRHIGGDGLDLRAATTQAFPEIYQGIPAFPMPHVDHHSRFEVQDNSQVTMAFANGNLVDGDLPQVFQLGQENRFCKSPLTISLTTSQLMPKCRATS